MKTYEEMADDVFKKIDIYKKERQERIKYSRRAIVIAAGLFFVTCTIINMGIPAYARKIPYIGKVFSYIQDNLDITGYYSEYAFEVGDTAVNNGVSITLSEVYCDGNNLYISYLIESEKLSELYDGSCADNQLDFSSKMYASSEGIRKKIDQRVGTRGIVGEFLDNDTFAGVETISLFDEDVFPDSFDLSVDINQVGVIKKDQSKKDIIFGSWHFDIKVNVNHEDTRVIYPNVSENGYGIDRVIITPIMITVYTSYPDIYWDNIDYTVDAYSDLSVDENIIQYGVYDHTISEQRIPRCRVGKEFSIYVYERTSLDIDEDTDVRREIEKHAIISTTIKLQ